MLLFIYASECPLDTYTLQGETSKGRDPRNNRIAGSDASMKEGGIEAQRFSSHGRGSGSVNVGGERLVSEQCAGGHGSGGSLRPLVKGVGYLRGTVVLLVVQVVLRPHEFRSCV